MATNWNMKEATKAILSGDKEAMVDIGRRFPLTAMAIAQMGNNPGALTIINALPDHISVRKIESVLKDGVQESSDDVEEIMPAPVEEEKPKATGRGKKKVEKEEPVKAKEKKAPAKKNDEEDDLDSMSEVELFKLCKKKGIKAAPKQDKEYYIDLLTPADSDDEEDDNWEEEEKPAKKSKKPAKKKEDDEEDDDWDI